MRPCRPACRSGRLDHALPRQSIRTARQVPRFVPPSGRRPAVDAFLPWLSCRLGAALLPVLAVVVVPRFKNSHGRRPSIHWEGEPPKVGEPRRGAPVADRIAALRFSQTVELSTVFCLPTTGNIYRKKKLEAPYRFRGGAISREKGVRFHVENRPRGGAISRTGGVRFHVEKLAYPQGFSTGWACFGCFAVAFSLVTGRAPGRARLSPKVGGCDFTSCTGDAGTVASSPRCRHQYDAQRCRDGMTKGIEARRGRDLEQGSMRSTKARPRL